MRYVLLGALLALIGTNVFAEQVVMKCDSSTPHNCE
jgi:hypothetical protein